MSGLHPINSEEPYEPFWIDESVTLNSTSTWGADQGMRNEFHPMYLHDTFFRL